MRALLLLCVLAVGCLAHRPYPCVCPPLLTGNMIVSTQSEKLWMGTKFYYDALDQRLRVQQKGVYKNQTFYSDALLLYTEEVMYQIDVGNHNCTKFALKDPFHPMRIPRNATLVGQAVLGSSSGPGEGLLVNTWTGAYPGLGKYITTVTEFGCIPISSLYHRDDLGWVQISFFNNVKGIPDPGMLIPPDFCTDAKLESGREPMDFFDLFV